MKAIWNNQVIAESNDSNVAKNKHYRAYSVLERC
jgi:hypothetical protein